MNSRPHTIAELARGRRPVVPMLGFRDDVTATSREADGALVVSSAARRHVLPAQATAVRRVLLLLNYGLIAETNWQRSVAGPDRAVARALVEQTLAYTVVRALYLPPSDTLALVATPSDTPRTPFRQAAADVTMQLCVPLRDTAEPGPDERARVLSTTTHSVVLRGPVALAVASALYSPVTPRQVADRLTLGLPVARLLLGYLRAAGAVATPRPDG